MPQTFPWKRIGKAADVRNPALGCCRVPRRCARVALEVIDDTYGIFADAPAARTPTFRPVVGIDLDVIEIALFIPIACNRNDAMSLFLGKTDPRKLESRLFRDDAAHFAEQFLAGCDADDDLVQFAESCVEAVQPFDLS